MSAEQPPDPRRAPNVAERGDERADPIPDAEREPALDETQDEAIYVENAGLVLAWPFLPRFFEAIGLMREKRFVSPAARERAVVVLHSVGTGSPEAFEQQAALAKLLCGWHEEEPVPCRIDLTEAERRESEDLLASIVVNWAALKGTSAEGLRAAFLQREGRLARLDNGWQLMVQRTGYDVLLDKLPWAISLVVLPWMPQPLFVEW